MAEMNKYLFIILLLTGCGVEEETKDVGPLVDPPDWTGNTVEQSERFTINYDVDVIDGPLMGMVEEVWLDVQTCMGQAMPNPRLVIEYTNKKDIPDGYDGYYSTPRYIRARDTDPGNNRVLRHEFVHFILWHVMADIGHESPYFDSCT